MTTGTDRHRDDTQSNSGCPRERERERERERGKQIYLDRGRQ